MKEEDKSEYQEIMTRFFAEEISENDIVRLKDWLSLDPENRRAFDKENELWQDVNIRTKVESYNTETAWNHIGSKLKIGKTDYRSVTVLRKVHYRLLIAATSAAFILAMGGLSMWLSENSSSHQVPTASVTVSTHEGEKAHIFLADSTEVTLNSESSLQYNGYYNIKDRTVKFTGEAFFHVRTNPKKPFVVELNQIKISATGTRFNVFSFGNEDRLETTLEEGAITVSIKGREPLNLKSGQQAVYFVKSDKILIRDVATETYTSWKENKLRFNDTPFEEVLRRIGRKYNVKFEITNRDLLNLKYTATFIDESIEEVMEMLKTVSPITYKIYNRTLINDKLYLNPKIVIGKRKLI